MAISVRRFGGERSIVTFMEPPFNTAFARLNDRPTCFKLDEGSSLIEAVLERVKP
jgi:hypothetical protein